jgi:hypothetical protein
MVIKQAISEKLDKEKDTYYSHSAVFSYLSIDSFIKDTFFDSIESIKNISILAEMFVSKYKSMTLDISEKEVHSVINKFVKNITVTKKIIKKADALLIHENDSVRIGVCKAIIGNDHSGDENSFVEYLAPLIKLANKGGYIFRAIYTDEKNVIDTKDIGECFVLDETHLDELWSMLFDLYIDRNVEFEDRDKVISENNKYYVHVLKVYTPKLNLDICENSRLYYNMSEKEINVIDRKLIKVHTIKRYDMQTANLRAYECYPIKSTLFYSFV